MCVRARHSQCSEACFRLAQLFMRRWSGSLTATGVWAQVASLYPGILAEFSDGCIGLWFPAPFLLPVMGGQYLHLASSCCIFLGSFRQRNMQAMPRHLWETGTSPMWAACLAASAGATREYSTLMLGFSSPKEFGIMFECWVFQLQLRMPGIPAGG